MLLIAKIAYIDKLQRIFVDHNVETKNVRKKLWDPT
jgi:hypothetical protein